MTKFLLVLTLALLSLIVLDRKSTAIQTNDLALPQEKHLRNVRQLTFGGENAEAYFSSDGKKLIFQSTRDGHECDQIYTMNIDGSDVKLVSTGDGRTTCSYFFPGDKRILYSSTHLGNKQCPPRPDFSQGYVWAVYDTFDIFTAKPDGSDIKQLTTELGYDGGPFWSYDGKQIVYRAYHPNTEKEKADYTNLLKQNLIRPTVLDIWVMNGDGSNKRQVTHLNAASFAPYFFPDAKRIIFSSNVADPKGRDFDLYVVNVNGSGLERITYYESFDGFPMFSPDGKKLVFASNRHNAKPNDTNIFIADWVESVGV